MREVENWRQEIARLLEFGHDLRLVMTEINSAVHPVYEAISPLPIKQIHRAEHLTFLGEINLDRIIHLATAVDLNVASIRLARKNASCFALAQDVATVDTELVSMPTFAPVDPITRPEEAAMHIRSVAGIPKLIDDLLANVRDSVVVGILQTPDATGRRNVQRTGVP
jgi:hypothetical protein